ncbi:hypothetical protein [Flavobacterium sp.]|uniref:hypothetical protein n=1 Tax=Flavobacterium sp. TaxID=239 RepID=UPI003F69A7D9
MPYQPTLSDIEEAEKEERLEKAKSYVPTLPEVRTLERTESLERSQERSQQPKSFMENLSDVIKGIRQLPQTLSQTALGGLHEIATEPLQIPGDILRGTREYGQNILAPLAQSALKGAVRYNIPPFSFLPSTEKKYLESTPEIPSYIPAERTGSPFSEITKMVLSGFPTQKGIGIGEALTESLRELLPESLQKNLVSRLVTRGTGLSAGGAASSPFVGVTPTVGALTGLITPTASESLSQTLARRAVRSSEEMTPEKFSQRLASQPEGIKLPIGEIAGAPALQRLYTALQGMFGAGATKPYEQLNKFLKQKREEISKLPNETVDDPNQAIFDAYKEQYNQAKEHTNDAYAALSDLSDRLNVPFDRSAYQNSLDKIKNEVKELIGEEGKASKELAEKRHAPSLKLINTMDKPIENFSDARRVMQNINNEFSSPEGKEDEIYRRHLTKLKEGLERSIEDSTKDVPELKDAFDHARLMRINQGTFENLNKREKTPFYKLFQKGGDTGQFIDSYIKPSKGTKDQSYLLNSLVSKLPEDDREILSYHYLKSPGRKGGDTTLSEFISRLGNLNKNQRNILFKENAPLANQLVDISNLYPEGKIPEFEPKTGYTGSKVAQFISELSGAIAAASGGHFLPSALIAAIPALGRGAATALRSDWLKNAYLKSLERTPNKSAPPHRISIPARALIEEGVRNNGS